MANQKTFHLMITQVDGSLFDGDALSVTVPGSAGEMTILPEHSALISPLRAGTIVARTTAGGEESFSCTQGTLEVNNSAVTILV